jgi:hypothetical protein
LDLGVLASVPEYFVHLVTAPSTAPLSVFNGLTPIPPVGPSPGTPADTTAAPATPLNDYTSVPAPASALSLVPGRPRTQFLGTVLSVTSVSVPVPAAASGTGVGLRVGLLSPDGRRTTWIATASARTGRGEAVVRARAPTPASGIVLEALPAPAANPVGANPVGANPAGLRIGAPVVRTAGQGTYRVDGSLRDAVGPGRWRFRGMIGRFCVFTQPSAAGRAWVQGKPGGIVRVVSSTPWGDETLKVTAPGPAIVIRAEQFATGWQATVSTVAHPGSRPSRHAARVGRAGLLQAVTVPGGTSLVHFTYRPHRVLEGLVFSVLGVSALVGLVAWPGLRRRRRAFAARRRAAR